MKLIIILFCIKLLTFILNIATKWTFSLLFTHVIFICCLCILFFLYFHFFIFFLFNLLNLKPCKEGGNWNNLNNKNNINIIKLLIIIKNSSSWGSSSTSWTFHFLVSPNRSSFKYPLYAFIICWSNQIIKN